MVLRLPPPLVPLLLLPSPMPLLLATLVPLRTRTTSYRSKQQPKNGPFGGRFLLSKMRKRNSAYNISKTKFRIREVKNIMAIKKENTTGTTDKQKALETAMAQIEKAYGKGSIMRLGENQGITVEAVPTGSLGLDIALGIGGVPRGRIIEIYGPESSGKTTLALHILAEAQKLGGEAAFIDAEHALDPNYAKALGVDIDSMLISQPDTGEQGLEICEALVRSGAVDVVVVDSVAALTPKAEIEGDMGESHVGLLARLMSQALRKLAGAVSKTNCIVIFINQLREKVGVAYGNPEVTTGGRALKFYASVRIDVRRIETIKSGSDMVGNRTKFKVVKNKVAPPFRIAEADILYGHGISKLGELVDLGVKFGIVQKSGSWFSMGETRIGQGKEAVKQFLQDNPDVANEIEAKIRDAAAAVMRPAPDNLHEEDLPELDD